MVIPKTASKLLNILFPSLIFNYSGQDKRIYLTFDDGPTPGVTNFVLKCLDDFKARATFFCVGENVKTYTEVYQQIVLSGHQTGNHSWGHSDAFRVKNSDYIRGIERTDELIKVKLFRPPFGRIWPWQIYKLSKKYRIVMWDIMIPDYKADLDCDKVLVKLFPRISNGSIIVMHDSFKASKQLYRILPRLLEEFTYRGFIFESIPVGD